MTNGSSRTCGNVRVDFSLSFQLELFSPEQAFYLLLLRFMSMETGFTSTKPVYVDHNRFNVDGNRFMSTKTGF